MMRPYICLSLSPDNGTACGYELVVYLYNEKFEIMSHSIAASFDDLDILRKYEDYACSKVLFSIDEYILWSSKMAKEVKTIDNPNVYIL